MKQYKRFTAIIFLVFASMAMLLSGCNDSSGSDSNETSALPAYGGSIPRGDYVTAEINGDRVTIKNMTEGTEITLSFGDIPETIPDVGTSIIKVTEHDNEGNRYLMALSDGNVLGMHKMNADLEPLETELPIYMFNKSELTAADLKGRSFNFMELFTETEGNTYLEIGIVGFDTDESGRLYGAAYDSELDKVYSITDEDGIEGNEDDFSLDRTEEQSDGSLVLWENGMDNWRSATTLTGSASGPVVMDHGPDAGGGAGFAFPQVTEDDPDVFWDTVAGDYFLIVYADTDTEIFTDYFKCTVEQVTRGKWAGRLDMYYPTNPDTSIIQIEQIIPLAEANATELESYAGFEEAESETVQTAGQGIGIFQENATEPEYFVTFDPEGNYIMGIKLAGEDSVTGYALGIRDRNWTVPDEILR